MNLYMEYRCDVCELKLFRKWYHWFTARVRRHDVGWPSKKLDICDECWEKFKQWAKEEKRLQYLDI